MDYHLTEDLWTMVLARLPIKIFTGFKLVCKQWKSILESPFFRDVFMSLRQNSSSSSWSLMCKYFLDREMVGHYQCETWGLDRSLGSYIVSFLAGIKQKYKDRLVSVEAYSDAGLILIHIESTDTEKEDIYVANPVSRESVEIFLDLIPIGFETNEYLRLWGLVSRTENDVLLGYKVVLFESTSEDTKKLSCRIYSSETGLWSLETLHLPHSFNNCYCRYPISLNGNLHWLGKNMDRHDLVVSMDFYDTSTTGSVRCRVTPFPDLEKTTYFLRFFRPCQGFLHYMNIVDGSKLCLWRLMSDGCWQLMFEISLDFNLTGLGYVPLTINPFDVKTAYFWSKGQESLLYINLHNGKVVIHNQLEGPDNGRIMIPVTDPRAMLSLKGRRNLTYINKLSLFIPFVLPKWLHRIPNKVTIKDPTTTAKTEKETSVL